MADSGVEECSPHPLLLAAFSQNVGANQPLRFPRPYQSLLKFLSVIHVVHLIRRRLVEVVVVIRAGDPQILPLLWAGSLQQLRSHNGGQGVRFKMPQGKTKLLLSWFAAGCPGLTAVGKGGDDGAGSRSHPEGQVRGLLGGGTFLSHSPTW